MHIILTTNPQVYSNSNAVFWRARLQDLQRLQMADFVETKCSVDQRTAP